GKELDMMHGLNTYDYGARQYDPTLGRWDRMDPMCEKYYSVSPYAYCHDNPVMLVDPDGRDDYYDRFGNFLGTNGKKTDYIFIANRYTYDKSKGLFYIKDRTALANADLNAKVWSKILTKTLSMMEGVDVKELEGGAVSVLKVSPGNGNTINFETFNNPDMNYGWGENASQIKNKITAKIGYANEEMFATRSNIQNMLGVEEYTEHMKKGLSHYYNDRKIGNKKNNIKIFNGMMDHPTWPKTTQDYKNSIGGFY
uniref:RHS repeat-associated core domain-containing protein n=1 Tax=Prevotella heparinolytica TaxID=28113 RepID=UPI0035A153DB